MAVHDSERVIAATLAVCLGLLGCSSSPKKSSKTEKDGGSSQGSGQANGGGTGGNGTATGRAGKGGSGSGGAGSKDGSAGTSKDGGAGTSKDGSTSKDGATFACQKTDTDDNCDGVDGDCDGKVDESYAASGTNCGVGACAATGATSCVNGKVVDSCAPGEKLAQTDATCDGVDDDCDGTIDDDYVVDASCGVGACKPNNTPSSCTNGIETQCRAGTAASNDTTCDGVDDDCDGTKDEDYVSVGTTCGTGPCAATGSTSCVNGTPVDSCTQGAKLAQTDTTCDGIDDDCDGSKDEEYASIGTTCGVGACAASGTTSCANGHPIEGCTPGAKLAQTDTTCDGIDDDCDGSNDEEYASIGTTCGIGACAASGTTSCTNGHPIDSCTPGAKLAQTDTTCDGVDDDCDGVKDEEYAAVGTTCGVGACAASGTTSCTNGHPVDGCTPGAKPAQFDTTCNGIDDDCDGSNDEEYVPNNSCGTGVCRTANTPSSCSGGIETACAPGAGAVLDRRHLRRRR